MEVFPNIVPTEIEETPTKEQIITPLGNGMVQRRAKFTRARRKFKLSYNTVSLELYYTISDFFTTNQGTTFEWVHPIRNKTYTVGFDADEIACQMQRAVGTFTVALSEV
jgi:hypothetical protein